MRTSLGVSLVCTKGFADSTAESAFSAALNEAESAGLTSVLPSVLYGLWVCRSGQGRFAESIETANRLQKLGSQTGIPAVQAKGAIGEGISLLHLGRIVESSAVLDRAVVHATSEEPPRTDDPFRFQLDDRVVALCQAARAHTILGHFQKGRSLCAGAIQYAASIGDPQVRAYSYAITAEVACLREDFGEAVENAELGMQPALEYGFLQEYAWATMLQSYAKEQIAPNPENRVKCAHLLERYDAAGGVVASTEFRAMLAQMQLAAGALYEAGLTLQRSFATMERIDEAYFLSPLQRIKSELQHRAGQFDDAEATLNEAANVAKKQESLLHELSAVLVGLQRFSDRKSDKRILKSRAGELLKRIDGENSGLQARGWGLVAGARRGRGIKV